MTRSSCSYFSMVLFITLVTAFSTAVDAQELEWVQRAGGSTNDLASAIATDDMGNTYVTGQFGGGPGTSATFGPGEANQTTLVTADGTFDIFVAKYDPDGGLVWAKNAGALPGGGGTEAGGRGIGVDALGNSYVTGVYIGACTFGAGEPNQTTLTPSPTGGDIFVAKYDPNGGLFWAKKAGGPQSDGARSIVVDASGNSYVTGVMFPTVVVGVTFGAGETNQTVLFGSGLTDIFVAKYDPNGLLQWARGTGSAGHDGGGGVAIDAAGNSYVTGGFGGGLFVAKYNSVGTQLWSRTVGGASGSGIIVSGNDSYVAGNFFGTATFGQFEANETTLTSAGSGDIFVAKYDSDGFLLWAKRAGGLSTDLGNGISVDGDGNAYLTGSFRSLPATFGAGESNETNLSASGFFGLPDIFVAKYDGGGSFVWAKRAGGPFDDSGNGVAADVDGNSYVAGHFNSAAEFGTGETNQTNLFGTSLEIFVAKFGAGGNNPPIVSFMSPTTSVNEGETETYSWTVSDPDSGETFTLVSQTCGTGGTLSDHTFNSGDGSGSFDCTFPDGPDSSVVSVEVADSAPESDDDSITVTVNNVAPNIVSVTNNGPIILGENATITVSATDVPADPLRYEFDCNGDSSFEISPQGGNSHICVATSFVAGTNTVNVRVTDDDGGASLDSTVVDVLTPQHAIADIIPNVQALAPPLPNGQANGMIVQLKNAIRSLDRGDVPAACNQLQEFIDDVNAAMAGPFITAAEGQPLIDAAQRVRDALGCP